MSSCTNTRPTDRTNHRRFHVAMLGWALVFVLSSAVASTNTYGGIAHFAATLAPSVAGLPAVGLFIRYIRDTDELVRLIELQALAIAAGALFVTLPAVQVAQGALGVNAIAFVPLLTLSVVYGAAVTLLRRRYQ